MRARSRSIVGQRNRRGRGGPPEQNNAFAERDAADGRKWIAYDAVELPTDVELNSVSKGDDDILAFRMVRTDKNAAARGYRMFAEHQLIAQCQGVLP